MRRLLLPIFMILLLIITGCGASGGGTNSVSSAGTDKDYTELKEAGYYADIVMQPNGVFYVRKKLDESTAKTSGIVYKADFNEAGKLEKITSLYAGKNIIAPWLDTLNNRAEFSMVTLAYEDGYIRYTFKDAGLAATTGFYGAYSIRYKTEKDGAKVAYLYDKTGNQSPTAAGYAQLLFTYENNALSRIGFANTSGERVKTTDNLYSIRIAHNDNSGKVLPAEISNYGSDDSLLLNAYGYARIAFKYDDTHRLIEIRHYGIDNSLRERNVKENLFSPMNVENDMTSFRFSAGAITKYTYSDNKKTISFYGKDEQPMGVKNWGNIASIVIETNPHHMPIRITTLAPDGSPVPIDKKDFGDNPVQLELGYDDNGNCTKWTLVGREGNMVSGNAGFGPFSTVNFTYDDKRRLTQMAFLGTSGEPATVTFPNGAVGYKVVYEYNDDNVRTAMIVYDTAEQEVRRDAVTQLPPAPPTTQPPQQVQPQAQAPRNTQGQITGSEVRMRAGAGQGYEILGHFSNGEYVSILESKNGWYRVRRAGGSTGWVSAKFCRIV